jgi:hypothetical protein
MDGGGGGVFKYNLKGVSVWIGFIWLMVGSSDGLL